ncbi:Rhamnogalacturonan endolyase YesW precursor [Pirellulimonas nuda]|uniref:Rhamnogalacturonan endolyase YesW n=1 Tax=Pirellulimonas nuda TaxID=2528009 RepID=A0A518DE68_9BACT|nr:DNRLRE domain-containing protein [Pirellulimonas nuda]QDU89784.1 Rhamnogalacturonan endolyase YesW precursor [Pirellulimonas nuda]
MKQSINAVRYARRGRNLRMEPLEDRRLLALASLTAAADTFTRSGVNAGGASTLDVLDANGPGDRMAYVRFDLSQLNIDAISNATLSLYKAGGTRNDTIVPDRFDVYGLTNAPGATPQNWSESTLAEGGLGAEYAHTGGDGVDPSLVFSLDQESGAAVTESVTNAQGAPQTITGQDLVAFLNSRVDDNGLVTFITRVDAGAVRGWGYSSREDADPAVRPTLTIEYDEDAAPPATPQFYRQVEKLNRGVVVVRPTSNTAYVGWRMLGDDPQDVAFNLYRSASSGAPVKLNASPLTQSTNFVDSTANLNVANSYFVRAVVGGQELAPSESYTLAAASTVEQHLTIPLQIPAGGTTPSGESFTYNANDASVGDLNGDGQYEVILKWDPSNSKDNSQSGYTGNTYVDAYTLEGELMWRIDLGRNIRSGAHYTQMAVYDFDGDGRAEIVLKTAPGTIDGQGNAVLLGGDSVADDFRNSSGYVLSGPEYLTVFDGLTGAELDSIPFAPVRGSVSGWGDTYGNRVDRFTVGVAYFDGTRPSVVFGRGYYGPQSGRQSRNEVAAYDWRDGHLTQRWIFQAATNGANPDYIGQGAHSLTIGDVDGDGFDEVIYGASAIDHDGTGLYTTGLGHGDALHMSDMDPTRPGLEVFMVHESRGEYESEGRDAGGELRDAATGALLFQIPSNNDVGRGVAMDIDPNHLGYEFWASTDEGTRMIYNVSGEALYETPGGMMYNFGVWWDGDLSRELLDGTTISKWNNPGRTNLVSSGSSGINSTAGLSSNNGTKSTPSLSADILGDWREEVIWRRSDNSALEIWTTTIVTQTRLTTLMHDTQYREAIAWQNDGYNQPPHPSFYLGAGMQTPPQPLIYFGGELRGDYNNDGSVDAADYTVWRDSLGSVGNPPADGYHNGVVDQSDYGVWRENFGAVAPAANGTRAAESVAAAGLITDQANAPEPPTRGLSPVGYAAAPTAAPALASGAAGRTQRAPLASAMASPAPDHAPLLLLLSAEEQYAANSCVLAAPITQDAVDSSDLDDVLQLVFETWDSVAPLERPR